MATFGLVHGICAGAWCWELLTPHLEAAGHEVVAVDLPCDNPVAGVSDYAAVVDEALGAADDIVLVGHSTGGLTIPLVAARRPVRDLVFLCAIVPAPGKSQIDEGFDFSPTEAAEWQVFGQDGSVSVRPEAVGRYVAQDVDAELIAANEGRLRRQFLTPFAERCPLESLPDVPSRYILCREDRIVDPDWSRRIAPERLGVKPIELPGSHSPMLSRPRELADVLLAPLRSGRHPT